jgi:hypothetical protein
MPTELRTSSLSRSPACAVLLAVAEQSALDAHVALVVHLEKGDAAQERALTPEDPMVQTTSEARTSRLMLRTTPTYQGRRLQGARQPTSRVHIRAPGPMLATVEDAAVPLEEALARLRRLEQQLVAIVPRWSMAHPILLENTVIEAARARGLPARRGVAWLAW